MQEETRIEGRCTVHTSMGMTPDSDVCRSRRNSCKNGHMAREIGITKKLVKTLKSTADDGEYLYILHIT